MSEERIIKVALTAEEIGVREASSEYEDKVESAAFKKVVIVDGEKLRIKDVEPQDGGCIAYVVAYRPEVKPVIETEDIQVDGIEQEKSEEEISEEDKENQLPESKAKEGPFGESTWEITVVEMCAILDMLALAEIYMQPPPNGKGLSPLIHAVNRLRSFFYACVGEFQIDEARKTADGKQIVQVDISNFLKTHYRAWSQEAQEVFAELARKQTGKTIVAARMVPGQGFNPKGGNPKGMLPNGFRG